MKYCSGCKKWKTLDEFYNRADSEDGKRARCKMCSHKTNIAGSGNQNLLEPVDDKHFGINLIAMSLHSRGWIFINKGDKSED